MGTITGYGSKHSHEFKLTVNGTSTSIANNTSEVSFSFTIYKASYSWSQWNSITYTITINGVSYTGTIPSYSAGSTMTIRSGSQTIAHNNDGTKSINYSFSVNDGSGQSYTCGNASASGSLTLTTIPRYANLTKLEVKSKTVNSITLNYTTDRPAWLFVNLNNGENWLNGGEPFKSNTTSGEFTIYYKDRASTQRLDTNTSYKITVLCRALNRDSNLDTTKDISVTTYDIAKLISVPNVNIGSSHTITWSNPSGANTSLKLCKTDNSTIIDYGTVTGTSKAITPTASTIYALTPNSNTYTARYIITTTVNSKSYTNYKDFTFTVTNSNPAFSNFTYQDTNTTITALTGNNQILVNGYSNVKATISTANKATAKNSATMKTYKMLIGSKNATANYSSSADVNLSLSSVTSGTIDVYATDSRGNSTKVTKNATFKNYSKIAITSLTATRTNNVGTAVTLAFKATYWNSSFGSVTNAITSCIYKYKLTSASSYTTGETTLTYSISGNTITGSLSIKGDLGADGFNASNSYNIQLSIADKLSTTTSTIILGSGNPAIAVYKNNVAIGQKYDTSDGSKLQVNGITKFKDVTRLYKSSGDVGYFAKRTDTGTEVWMGVGGGGINHGVYSNKLGKWMLYGDDSSVHLNGHATSADYASNYRGVSTNLNNATSTGWYRYNSGASNIPSYISQWGVVVVQKDGDWVFQTAYSTYTTDARIAHRGYINGSWTGWSYVMPGALKTLYNNTSGTTGTVTLSETSANFTYLEIFFSRNTNMGYDCTKIYSPNGKKANLNLTESSTNGVVLYNALVTISGTSITFNGGKGLAIYGVSGANSNVWCDGYANGNEIKIYRVIGYR